MRTIDRLPLAANVWAAASLLFILSACGGADGSLPADALEVSAAGFETPESILHDSVSDVYLVSNISGSPVERDDAGFISRVSPEGEVLELRWIDGRDPEVTLNAPKGMAIRRDSLFVTDINCIRIFHRVSGLPQGRRCFETATFLNDVDVGPEGSLFVTDSGLEEGTGTELEASGRDAVFRLVLEEGRRGSTLASGADLGDPNGIAVGSRGIFVTTFGSGEIFRLTPSGERTVLLPPVAGRQLDGIVNLSGGGFAFSSWGEKTIFLVDEEGRMSRLIEDLDAPADIGYDASRNRILVPLFNENRLLFVSVP